MKLFVVRWATLCSAIFAMLSQATAQDYDICAKVLDSIILKTTTRSQNVCRAEGAGRFYCIINPVCCTRGCLALPDCTVVKQVHEGIDYITRGDELTCFKRDAASKLYDSWKAGFLEFQFDNITGGAGDILVDFAAFDTERLYLKAVALPQNVKALLREIIAPVHDGGQTGYGINHIDAVRVLSENDAITADWWLQRGAITLGNVIIINQTDYDQITNSGNAFTLSDLKYGLADSAYSNAIALLVHEMVHVKQYDRLGKQTFMESYLLSDAWKYGRGAQEQEAYAFAPEIVRKHGSAWCEQTRAGLNADIQEFDLPVTPIASCSYLDVTAVTTYPVSID